MSTLPAMTPTVTAICPNPNLTSISSMPGTRLQVPEIPRISGHTPGAVQVLPRGANMSPPGL